MSNTKDKRIDEVVEIVNELVNTVEECYSKGYDSSKTINTQNKTLVYWLEKTSKNKFITHIDCAVAREKYIAGKLFRWMLRDRASATPNVLRKTTTADCKGAYINTGSANIEYISTGNNDGELWYGIKAGSSVTSSASKMHMKELYNVKGKPLSKKDRGNVIRQVVTEYWEHVDKVLAIETADKLRYSKNIILRGAPGTGKTYLAKDVAAEITGIDRDKLGKSGQYKFVQFHPSYDYTDFVEGLRPTIDPKTKKMGFEHKYGIFANFIEEAMKPGNEEKKYVFVIDEINRGEISKILGELFFSIDPDYRGVVGMVETQYANMPKTVTSILNNGFYVPENVYIIGTMNDIDRSVDSFDFAMRRRFRFIEVKVENTMPVIFANTFDIDEFEDAAQRLEKLNRAIVEHGRAQGLNSNYHIGPSYFQKLKDIKNNKKFETLWDDYLEPLIEEYLRGDPLMKESLEKIKNEFLLGVPKVEDLYWKIFEVLKGIPGSTNAEVYEAVYKKFTKPTFTKKTIEYKRNCDSALEQMKECAEKLLDDTGGKWTITSGHESQIETDIIKIMEYHNE